MRLVAQMCFLIVIGSLVDVLVCVFFIQDLLVPWMRTASEMVLKDVFGLSDYWACKVT